MPERPSPAFEAAIYAGLRAAGATVPAGVLKRFSTYLGEGFQIRNDLNDWQADDSNKRKIGLDVLADRPTILHVFAMQSPDESAIAEFAESFGSIIARRSVGTSPPVVSSIRRVRESRTVCAKRCATGALAAAAEFPSDDIQELMRFLVRMVLWEPANSRPPAS